jgi:choline dehydrogenase-like flavoprotein
VRFDASYGDNEARLQADAAAQATNMLKSAGAVSVTSFNTVATPGEAIHEMGTARMGINPEESVLDQWNRAHDVPNLFVTDGACMTSSSCVNPSLTYMALTARAANYAAEQLKTGAI